MTTLKHKIFIHAPPERVWEALADLESVRHYNPMAHRVTITTAKREGPGAERRCEGPQGAFCERVLSWDVGRSITIELSESKWPVAGMRWTTRLQPDSAGTLMLQETTYEPKFGILGHALDRVVLRRKLTVGIRDVFHRFRAHVEGLEAKARS
jgi:uncharacterized protein YndB with AHSA1/START domain